MPNPSVQPQNSPLSVEAVEARGISPERYPIQLPTEEVSSYSNPKDTPITNLNGFGFNWAYFAAPVSPLGGAKIFLSFSDFKNKMLLALVEKINFQKRNSNDPIYLYLQQQLITGFIKLEKYESEAFLINLFCDILHAIHYCSEQKIISDLTLLARYLFAFYQKINENLTTSDVLITLNPGDFLFNFVNLHTVDLTCLEWIEKENDFITMLSVESLFQLLHNPRKAIFKLPPHPISTLNFHGYFQHIIQVSQDLAPYQVAEQERKQNSFAKKARALNDLLATDRFTPDLLEKYRPVYKPIQKICDKNTNIIGLVLGVGAFATVSLTVMCTQIGIAIGAIVGTALPIPILGTLIGGLVGGLIGFLSGLVLGALAGNYMSKRANKSANFELSSRESVHYEHHHGKTNAATNALTALSTLAHEPSTTPAQRHTYKKIAQQIKTGRLLNLTVTGQRYQFFNNDGVRRHYTPAPLIDVAEQFLLPHGRAAFIEQQEREALSAWSAREANHPLSSGASPLPANDAGSSITALPVAGRTTRVAEEDADYQSALWLHRSMMR